MICDYNVINWMVECNEYADKVQEKADSVREKPILYCVHDIYHYYIEFRVQQVFVSFHFIYDVKANKKSVTEAMETASRHFSIGDKSLDT